MRIALAQIVTGIDVWTNLDVMSRWATKAASEKADVVVFPEASMRAFGHRLTDIAEALTGPWATRVRQIAQECELVVVAGMFTPGRDEGRVRNTLLVTGGGVEAHYDKIHLFDAFGFAESDTVDAGEALVVIEVGGMRLGLATCYDIRFPHLFTALARKGADAVLVPTSWGAGEGKVEAWRTLATARALDSTAYVLACGQGLPSAAGVKAKDGAPTGVGHSIAVSPTGRVLAEAGEAPELIVVDIDAETVATARRVLPVLANARDL